MRSSRLRASPLLSLVSCCSDTSAPSYSHRIVSAEPTPPTRQWRVTSLPSARWRGFSLGDMVTSNGDGGSMGSSAYGISKEM